MQAISKIIHQFHPDAVLELFTPMAIELKIEPLQSSSFDTVDRLFAESGMSGLTIDQLTTRLKSNCHWQFLVCLKSDNETATSSQIVGVIFGRQVADEAEIDDLIVKREFRRKGIGTAILKYALHQVWLKGGRKVFLEVRSTNFSALQLYFSIGFTELNRRREYYSNPTEDALVLGVVLGEDPENI